MTTGTYTELLKNRGFFCFFFTQFLGAFTDNFYKIIVTLVAKKLKEPAGQEVHGQDGGCIEAGHLHFAFAQREALAPYLLRESNAGIPAFRDELYFFFSGPALLPTLGTTSLAVSLAIVLVVSVLSGFYPAIIAMRVTPVEAMATED